MPTNLMEMFLWRDLAIFLLICTPLGALISLLLIVHPRLMERINRIASHWISTRHVDQLLDQTISIEHWFYRHHRAFGSIVMLGAAYVFIFFGILFDKVYALQHLNWKIPISLIDGLLDALVLSALTGSVVAFIVGLFLWLRPSLLRGTEEVANQWLSTRRAARPLEIPRNQVDEFVAQHAQRVGWLLLLGSLALLVMVLRALV